MDKLEQKIVRRFHEACEKYSLLEDGDRILIGLSGGKDSLLLTELLGRQAQIFKPHIEVHAVHVRVRERGYRSDTSYLEAFCEHVQVPFRVLYTEIKDPSQPSLKGKEADPCFLCSWYRRKALLNLAQTENFNKLALGHHRDDILETLIMNLVYQGSFTTMMPRLKLDKMPLEWIRPLCLIDEADIRQYAEAQGYEKQPRLCEFEHESSRAWAKQQLSEWELRNPEIRASLWNAVEKNAK